MKVQVLFAAMKTTRKLRFRILLFFSVFIIILSTIITSISLWTSLNVANTIFAREGIAIVKRTVGLIDGDKFEALSKSLDEEDPFYEEMQLELLRIRNEMSVLYLYTIAPGGTTGYRYIIDGSGEKDSEIFSSLGDEISNDDYGAPFFKTWETGVGQNTSLEKSDWGYLISVYEPILNSRGKMVGIVGCDFDAEFLLELIKTQVTKLVILGIFFALCGVAVLFFLIQPVFLRIKRISDILTILAGGEGNLTDRITIKGNDEIDTMADLFNKTLDRICELIVLIKDQTVNLSNVGTELSENMNSTAAAVTQITGSIQNIKTQVLYQSSSVTETSATMEQVVDNIDRLNTQIEAQTHSVSQSSAAVEQMLANIQSVSNTLLKNTDNIQKLNSAASIGRSSLEEVAQDIQGIARESEGILEINAVMQAIASQTNLLSMNAAIEAAHAGDAGKGFAVVADEIRKLAESSSEQSKTIQTVLKKIKEAIDKIAQSTSVVLDKFQDIDSEVRTVSEQALNIRSAMEEQTEGNKQVLDALSQLQKITMQVKEGSAEMLSGSHQVIKESKNLAAATGDITTGINEIASGADYINSAVERVHTATKNNQNHIAALSGEVKRFKVISTAEYTWDRTFAAGHEEIDAQHKTLFSALNNLVRACHSGSRVDFDENISFLGSYVEKHFTDEERIQRNFSYPGYMNHKMIHDKFKEAVKKASGEWLAAGPSEDVLKEVRIQVGGWLINHIKSEDVKIGAFIRSKKR